MPSGAGLDGVLWIGGAPCTGKSTIGRALADAHRRPLYGVDEGFEAHVAQLDPHHQPALTHWLSLTWEERWSRPVAALVEEAIACYTEHFDLIRSDVGQRVADLEPGRGLIVEGTALLPALVAELLGRALGRALWLVPSERFQRDYYAKRPWVHAILAQCADPSGAFEAWMARDAAFAVWVKNEALRLGLPCLTVDGTLSLAETTAWAAGRLALEAPRG